MRPPTATSISSKPSPKAPTRAAPMVQATRTPRAPKLVDDRIAERDGDGMGAGVRLQLGEDVPHVALHRLLRDEEALGDVGVRHAVGEKLEDLPLPLRQHL